MDNSNAFEKEPTNLQTSERGSPTVNRGETRDSIAQTLAKESEPKVESNMGWNPISWVHWFQNGNFRTSDNQPLKTTVRYSVHGKKMHAWIGNTNPVCLLFSWDSFGKISAKISQGGNGYQPVADFNDLQEKLQGFNVLKEDRSKETA